MSRMITAADFDAARVANPAQAEIIRQTLYDFQIYPGAGTQSLTFFQQPVGQGFTSALGATAATGKTTWDTNMQLGGQLPSGMQFLAESIEVMFYPGSVSTTNTFTVDTLTFFLAAASAVPTMQVDDASAFYQSGLLTFNILNKIYLQETPLGRFPPKTQLQLPGAIASNSATTSEVGFARAFADGRPYYLEPPILLQPAMNWSVALTWPGLVAMTSGFNARVGVILDGALMRASQ
jgi:hypothetical protein